MALTPSQIGVRSIGFHEQCFLTPFDVMRIQDTRSLIAVIPIMNGLLLPQVFSTARVSY